MMQFLHCRLENTIVRPADECHTEISDREMLGLPVVSIGFKVVPGTYHISRR